MVLTPCAVFADTAEVPLMLTVEAAPLEFTVTESIQMSVIQGNSDLTITPVTVTNNGSEKLKVSQIEITTESGWSLASSETDFSTSDSKGKLAFTLNSHDFSGGTYTPGDELSAGGSKEYQLAGKISSQADLMATGKVSDFVVTVEKATNLIEFIISVGAALNFYQAEEGMTWDEWVASSYNTDGYSVGSDGYIHDVSSDDDFNGVNQPIIGYPVPSYAIIRKDATYTYMYREGLYQEYAYTDDAPGLLDCSADIDKIEIFSADRIDEMPDASVFEEARNCFEGNMPTGMYCPYLFWFSGSCQGCNPCTITFDTDYYGNKAIMFFDQYEGWIDLENVENIKTIINPAEQTITLISTIGFLEGPFAILCEE